MRSLFIDTTSFFMNLAIIEDNNILYNFSKEVRNDMASQIVPQIKSAFDNLTFTINDLDRVYVVSGPGSFTGIRVGVTAAKIIGWATKANLVPLSSLELLATTITSATYLIPMIDARRGNVYTAVYDKNLNYIIKDSLVSYDEFIKDKKNFQIISYDNIKNSIKPKLDILKIVNKHLQDPGVNPNALKPNYLKLTEAEENRINDKRNN